MDKKLIVFNIIHYSATGFLLIKGVEDPSASLGYGFFLVALWIIEMVILGTMLWKNEIKANTLPDKIGVFMVTPVPVVVGIYLVLMFANRFQ